MTILFFLLVIALVACEVLQYIELGKYNVTTYEMAGTPYDMELKIAVLSDLHMKEFGKENNRLLSSVRELRPDLIILVGDMISCKGKESNYQRTARFIVRLTEIAPTFYGFGNHESRLLEEERENHEIFLRCLEQLEQNGVHILRNRTAFFEKEGIRVPITGLELPLDYYEKKVTVPMEDEVIAGLLPDFPTGDEYQILIAHNPAYAKQYAAYGAGLVLCGHTHGGLVRIPGIGSLISPELTLFPEYDAGYFELGETHLFVSKGLGTHTFHIRVFDRAELLNLICK